MNSTSTYIFLTKIQDFNNKIYRIANIVFLTDTFIRLQQEKGTRLISAKLFLVSTILYLLVCLVVFILKRKISHET